MTRDKLYELVDAVCIPGAASSTDDKPLHQRFAMAACGKSGSSTSGFTELDKKRKLADVAKEYESVQAYQCSSCRRTLAAGLAIRPPSESQRLYIPGPKVASALPGHELDHVVAVYTATHSHALEKAGYMPSLFIILNRRLRCHESLCLWTCMRREVPRRRRNADPA